MRVRQLTAASDLRARERLLEDARNYVRGRRRPTGSARATRTALALTLVPVPQVEHDAPLLRPVAPSGPTTLLHPGAERPDLTSPALEVGVLEQADRNAQHPVPMWCLGTPRQDAPPLASRHAMKTLPDMEARVTPAAVIASSCEQRQLHPVRTGRLVLVPRHHQMRCRRRRTTPRLRVRARPRRPRRQ